MLIFSLEFPTSLDFHNTRVVLYPNTQPSGLGYGCGIFLYRPVRGLGFPQHTRTSLSVTHEDRVCPVSIDCVRVCACAYLNYGSIWLPITWVITRPPNQARPRLTYLWVCNRVHRSMFTHGGVIMHRQARCMGVGGVMLLRGVSSCPRGAGWADTPAGKYARPPQVCAWR